MFQFIFQKPRRKRAPVFCVFLLLQFSFSLAVAQTSSELVSFSSGTLDLSLFKQQKLGQSGLDAFNKSRPNVKAHLLTVPNSKGAVILLPGVNGVQNSHLQWGTYLNSLGYTSLIVDHYGSRNALNFKDLASVPVIEDAVGALNFIVKQKYATADKVALFGFDRGASRALAMLSTNHPFSKANLKFAAGVALYPNCASHRQFSAPILMAAGGDDHLITMDTCKKLTQLSIANGRDVSFHIYEGATHFFDDPAYKRPMNEIKAPLWYASNQYSSQAHSQARTLIGEFIKKHLK